MEKFKMQFVHPSTESEFIEWLNNQPKNNKPNCIDVINAANNQIRQAGFATKDIDVEQLKQLGFDPVSKAAIEQIQNAEINSKGHFVKKSDLLVESKDFTLTAKVDTKSINIEVSEDGETCYMSGGFLDNLVKIMDRILPYNQRVWKRKMKRVNKRNR